MASALDYAVARGVPGARHLRYQFLPERELKPNERLLPGIKGGDYQLREGETAGDEPGSVFDAQGNRLSFRHPPNLREFADLFGNIVGGGAPKGAIASGGLMRWPARGELPKEASPTTPAFAEALAASMRRNKDGGYPAVRDMPNPPPARLVEKDRLLDQGLETANKALTTVSSLTPNDLARAERARAMGFHTPIYHATQPIKPQLPPGQLATGTPEFTSEQIDLLQRGAPFLELDPFRGRGALYTADTPKATLAGGAAQIDPYTARIYGGVAGGPIFGETALPAGLARELPEQSASVADIMYGISRNPSYAPNMEAAVREAQNYRQRSGGSFDPNEFQRGQGKAEQDLATRILATYYDPTGKLIPAGEFRPVSAKSTYGDTRIPNYSEFERGRGSNLWDKDPYGLAHKLAPRSGMHSTMQTALGNAGFVGAQVADETLGHGRTIAMLDPAMVRWGGAAFKDPSGDLLSGRVPPSWLLPPREDERRMTP